MTYLTFHLCALRKSYHLSQEQWVVRQGVPQVTLMVKNLPDNAKDGRDMGLIPGSGRSPGGGHGSPLQYSFLEKPMDRGARWVTVHRVTKSRTEVTDLAHTTKRWTKPSHRVCRGSARWGRQRDGSQRERRPYRFFPTPLEPTRSFSQAFSLLIFVIAW